MRTSDGDNHHEIETCSQQINELNLSDEKKNRVCLLFRLWQEEEDKQKCMESIIMYPYQQHTCLLFIFVIP